LTAKDVLAEPPQINCVAAYISVMNIQARAPALLAAKLGLMRQCQTVNKAGFTCAIGAKDKRDGLERNALGLSKGFEISHA
jgi:hypothetical protein